MSQPVFISYARDASREHARALHQALGGRTAFLDTEDIEIGERFPEALVDALFDAKVVVIFAEPHYFTRWYCLLEFRIARTPFLRVMDRAGASVKEKEDALRGLVVALPPRGVDPMMERFPPLVQGRNWPSVDDIEGIARLVDAALAADPPTLRERYASAAEADAARSFLLEATLLPPPLRIGNIPFVPQLGLPPSLDKEFVGRGDDLWRIHDLLWSERGDPATAAGLTGAIEATGGFGKTRLAVEYLRRFGPRHFRGGLFWINGESDPELQLYDVLQALNPDAPAIEHVRQGSGGVPGAVARAIRSRPDDAPNPLFVIDNVPEPEPNEPPKPLETWCPVLGDVPVLTTSRTRVALGTGGVVAIPIDTLDPASAVELLTTATPRGPLSDSDWAEIAEWVGYLPLALEILNKLLRSGEMTPHALRDLSREQRPSEAVDAAMESIRNVVPAGALRGITEAFSASYNLLSPEEQYAARMIAWMAPAPIPTFVVDSFGPEVFAPGVRAKLRNRSFVTKVRDGTGDFFGAMHRVLADFVRAQSKEPEEDVKVVVPFIMELMECAKGQGTRGSALVRECAPLALSVFANWIAQPTTEEDFYQASTFANRAGTTLYEWGHPVPADNLLASLVSALERRLGSQHPNTLSVMDTLALTWISRGAHAEAQELQERVLAASQRILGDYHPQTLGTMANLAANRLERGDHAGAQELLERVLDARRRISGDEHPETLTAMSNLALIKDAKGDLAAVQELERIYETRRRLLGEEHPATVDAMNNIAGMRFARGDHLKAQELQEFVVATRRRVLGDAHPDTLAGISNLALTRRVLGDFAGAQEIQEIALEAARNGLGLEHPSTTVIAWGLLRTYIARTDLESANRLLNENLHWLLSRDPASLPAQQRQIQAEVRKFNGRISARKGGGTRSRVLRLLTRALTWWRQT